MRLEDFDYDLPPGLIAQEPLERRDASRLMVLDRAGGGIEHRRFDELPALLAPGDLLVLNDTRVLAARLIGRRADPGTSARIETLLVEPIDDPGAGRPGRRTWRVMLKGPRRSGDRIDYGGGLKARVLERETGEFHLLELFADDEGLDVTEAIERIGTMPLPPYIRRTPGSGDPRESLDRQRYQTVFARKAGAVAAPTAGLHFTEELLERIRQRGVRVGTLTLHVGPGTFQPVRTARVEAHRLPPERYEIPAELAQAVAGTRRRGGRVVAVGTTVTRALEACAERPGGGIRAGAGRCHLFIRPGYRFRVIDALLTNFHLPRSTLIMLACAFAGRERLLAAYAEAVRERYRFYSYGDAMLLA